MSQLKTDEDSFDWGRKTWRNRKTFSVGRKQTGIHSGFSPALQGSERNHILLCDSG